MVVEWLTMHKEKSSQRVATLAVVEGSRHMHEKGKRKVSDSAEAK